MKTEHRTPDTTWLDKATEQLNPNVAVALAFSYLETYDQLDEKLSLRHDPHRFDGAMKGRFEKKLEFGWN